MQCDKLTIPLVKYSKALNALDIGTDDYEGVRTRVDYNAVQSLLLGVTVVVATEYLCGSGHRVW